jgi:hypothetical protein
MTGRAQYTTTRRTYRDSTLYRTYGGLVRASTTDAEDQRLRVGSEQPVGSDAPPC